MKIHMFFLTLVLTVVFSGGHPMTLASGSEETAGLKACIIAVDDRPCVYTPQWNEWQIHLQAKLIVAQAVCPQPPHSGPEVEGISAPVTWYVKYYGESPFVFFVTSMTDETIQTDGIRCLTGNPPADATWFQTLKADISYNSQVYSTTLSIGGPDAENYPCCPGSNCNPPSPPPCE